MLRRLINFEESIDQAYLYCVIDWIIDIGESNLDVFICPVPLVSSHPHEVPVIRETSVRSSFFFLFGCQIVTAKVDSVHAAVVLVVLHHRRHHAIPVLYF